MHLLLCENKTLKTDKEQTNELDGEYCEKWEEVGVDRKRNKCKDGARIKSMNTSIDAYIYIVDAYNLFLLVIALYRRGCEI